MGLRKLLLRIMLSALAASAAAGAAAILFSNGRDLVWRVVATGMITAVACGLLLATTRLLDREKTRSAGLLLAGTIVLEALLGLTVLWDVISSAAGGRADESIGLTMLAVFLAVPAAAFFLRAGWRRGSELAAGIGKVTSGVCLVLMLIGAWALSLHSDLLWETAAIVGLFGMLAAGCVAGRQYRRPWRWLGVAASLAACAMGVYGVWARAEQGPGPFAIVASAAVLIAYLNVAMLAPLKASQRWLRIGAIGAVIMTLICIDVLAVHGESDDRLSESMQRLGGAAGIVAACGSLALLILTAFNRRGASQAPASSEMREMALTCPHCGKKQSLPTGGAACAGCGLRIHIRLEEPRCPNCNYLLYMLASDRCPECGTVVRGDAVIVSA